MGHRWHRGALVLGVSVALAGVSTGAWAQSDEPSDPLVGSLLTVEDLPAGLTSMGIDEPPRFDIDDASFTANGGVRAIGQVWTMEDAPPLIVFDFRMDFPDSEAAAAYLEAAEPILSEAEASGLAPVRFTEPVGEDGRYYFGVQQVGDSEIQLHNHLFHVGPVAAKVFVAGSELPDGLAEAIAGAAAERIGASLAAGVPSATASTGADRSAEPSPSPEPSPSAAPGGSPGVSASPGALDALLAHVPEVIRASCDPHDPTEDAIAEVSCLLDGIDARYALYSNAIAIDGDFRSLTSAVPDARGSTCGEAAYVGPFRVGGTEDGKIVGQLACWADEDGATIVASDKRPKVLMVLHDPDGDLSALTAHPELVPIP